MSQVLDFHILSSFDKIRFNICPFASLRVQRVSLVLSMPLFINLHTRHQFKVYLIATEHRSKRRNVRGDPLKRTNAINFGWLTCGEMQRKSSRLNEFSSSGERTIPKSKVLTKCVRLIKEQKYSRMREIFNQAEID